eukprot:scaffold234380_cov32-Tisochrysis_lutea.AAC.2
MGGRPALGAASRRTALLALLSQSSACAMAWKSSGRTHEELVSNMRRDGTLKHAPVEQALRKVDRAAFVPPELLRSAHEDRPLPIGYAQTISAPHMHAFALDQLSPYLTSPDAAVLDVGAGSGYLLAVLAHMCPQGDIHGIEVIPELVEFGKANLKKQPVPETARITLEVGDGWKGVPGKQFDAIHVGAAAEKVPQALVSQLKSPGRMVVPVGPDGGAQQLLQVDKASDGTVSYKPVMDVRFVPLVQPHSEYDSSYIR